MSYQLVNDGNGHLWSAMPKSWCEYCGQDNPQELLISGYEEEEIEPFLRECPGNRRKRED